MWALGYWVAMVVIGVAAAITVLAAARRSVRAEKEERPEPAFYVTSTIDGERQPCLFSAAESGTPRPLLVALHPWSHGFNTYGDTSAWQEEARKRNWHCLHPDFRGPNWTPEACGSAKARQDVLDAIDYVIERFEVDEGRIYVAGGSGGGHMTLVMAAHAPDRWAAASAWCPITDLATWHAECRAADRKYWKDIEAVVGGPPGSSAGIDEDLRFRSPVHHLAAATDLPVDINTGIHDGHDGSVPIHHAVDAFNAIAAALGSPQVAEEELATLSEEQPLGTQEEQDSAYGRAIHLRRYAGASRLTVFEGGHEALVATACAWLETHRR
ncbi:MAG: prolyl oligopeptidase family serine peptidase [Candidatus Hydrogenedentes bacterium]|nr:prolyl oligopeptidase family serine peptidase [Candidatus Hydrogenedentota bacterium]